MKVIPKDEKQRIQASRRKSQVLEEIEKADRVDKIIRRTLSIVLTVTLLALTFALTRIWIAKKVEEKNRYRQETYAVYTNFLESATGIAKQREVALGKLKLDLLQNWAYIENVKDHSLLYAELEKARSVLEWSREQIRGHFRDLYKIFPAESVNERLDSERLYGEMMKDLDAIEERLSCDEWVLTFLEENQGAWHSEKNGVVFTDAQKQKEFDYFRRTPVEEGSRWRRDFGSGGVIESPPVQVPSH